MKRCAQHQKEFLPLQGGGQEGDGGNGSDALADPILTPALPLKGRESLRHSSPFSASAHLAFPRKITAASSISSAKVTFRFATLPSTKSPRNRWPCVAIAIKSHPI